MKSRSALLKTTEEKLAHQKLKQIDDVYNEHFSKKKLKRLTALGRIESVLSFLLTLLLILLVLLGISSLLHNSVKNVDTSLLITISYSLFGGALTLVVGVYAAIRISLGATNEYFNQPESKLFFNTYLIKYFDNGLIAADSFIYIVVGLVSALLTGYVDSFFQYSVSIILSIILFARFVVYSRKNKHERFRYYLTHSRYYSKISKKDKISDFIMMLDVFDDKGVPISDKFYKKTSERIYYTHQYINELKIKIKRDENIILEQNILEEFYVEYSKIIETPIQLFVLLIELQTYLNAILGSSSSLIKDASKTRENLCKALSYSLKAKAAKFVRLSFNIDDLPAFSSVLKDFHEIVFEKFTKIMVGQKVFVTSYSQIIALIEKHDLFYGLPSPDLSNEKEIVKGFNDNIERNLDSIRLFVEKEKEAILDLSEKLSLIENEVSKNEG